MVIHQNSIVASSLASRFQGLSNSGDGHASPSTTVKNGENQPSISKLGKYPQPLRFGGAQLVFSDPDELPSHLKNNQFESALELLNDNYTFQLTASDCFSPAVYDRCFANRENFKFLAERLGGGKAAAAKIEQLSQFSQAPLSKPIGPIEGTPIPDVAHFIWFSCKGNTPGKAGKALPEEAVENLARFSLLNPKIKPKLWTDDPHLMHRLLSQEAEKRPALSRIQVEPFFKLFSDDNDWEGISKKEKEILHSAIQRELSGHYKNPQSAKDIAQMVILKHEPGGFYDLDTIFHKPLPKMYAPAGVGNLYNNDENGLMLYNHEGLPQLNEMLRCVAGDYHVPNDVLCGKDGKIDSDMPRSAPYPHEQSGLKNQFFGHFNRLSISKITSKIYAMFDLKRVSDFDRRSLVDAVTAFPYRRISNNEGDQFFDLTHYVFKLPRSQKEWAAKPSVESGSVRSAEW